jgi:hypothetical protein
MTCRKEAQWRPQHLTDKRQYFGSTKGKNLRSWKHDPSCHEDEQSHFYQYECNDAWSHDSSLYPQICQIQTLSRVLSGVSEVQDANNPKQKSLLVMKWKLFPLAFAQS